MPNWIVRFDRPRRKVVTSTGNNVFVAAHLALKWNPDMSADKIIYIRLDDEQDDD